MSKDNGILSPLVGRSGAKAVIRKALRSGDVHLCFTGPPECGKSVALTAIEDAFEGAVYRDSSDVTKSKLKDILADDPPVLLLEEIDDMSYDAAKALSTALEQGRVTKTNQRKSYDVDISTQVFAAANEFSSLPGHIQTRFGDVHFPQYDREEFIGVCGELLPRSVSWIDGAETGREAAELVAEQRGRLSVRAAKRICTLASSLNDVPDISRALEDAEADVESQPVTPGDIGQDKSGLEVNMPTMVEELSDSELLEFIERCERAKEEAEERNLFGDSEDQADTQQESSVEGMEDIMSELMLQRPGYQVVSEEGGVLTAVNLSFQEELHERNTDDDEASKRAFDNAYEVHYTDGDKETVEEILKEKTDAGMLISGESDILDWQKFYGLTSVGGGGTKFKTQGFRHSTLINSLNNAGVGPVVILAKTGELV